MTQLSLFYQFPIQPIFEGHVRNTLICTEEDMQQLQNLGIRKLRKEKEEIQKNKILKNLLKTELDVLQAHVQTECPKLNTNLRDIENALLLENQKIIPSSETHSVLEESLQAKTVTQVTITQIDPAIHFTENFRPEMIKTFYNNTQMWSYTFGAWFYKLKRAFFTDSKLKRMLKLTYVDSLSITQELLSISINALEQITIYPMHDNLVSDLEAGLCLLTAFFASYPGTFLTENIKFVDVIQNLSQIFRYLNTEILATKNASPQDFYFGFNDPDKMKYFIPLCKGRHYAINTFSNHILIKIFIKKGVIKQVPGDQMSKGHVVIESKLTGTLTDDKLLYWTQILLQPKLGKEVPIFVHQQQYLRSGIVAIESLYLLWQILNSESIFGKRTGKFYLTTIFPHVNAEDVTETEFSSVNIQNFEFLMKNYVVPTYLANNESTISTLFPGLISIVVNESVRLGWDHNQNTLTQTNALHSQTKDNPFVEYIRSQLEETAELAVLEKHDKILFHFENGLNVTLSLALPRHRLFAMASSLFNVADLYDFLYFLVLGFIPVATVI